MLDAAGKHFISLCIQNTGTNEFTWYDLPLTFEEEDIIMTGRKFVADAEGMNVLSNAGVEHHIAIAEDIIEIANKYDLDTETIAELFQETEDTDEICKRLDSLIRIKHSKSNITEDRYPFIVGHGFAERYNIFKRMSDAGIPLYFDCADYGRDILFDWDVIEQRVDHLVLIPNI